MNDNLGLLQEFLTQDCDIAALRLIREAMRDNSGKDHRSKFEFNRFDLTLDFQNRVAILEDVLDVSPGGSLTMPMDDLRLRLEQI